MTYDEALAFWYGRIDYERRQPRPGDLKLDRMRALLRRLGDPHRRLRCVHVAGTKGKGSTSAIIAAILRAGRLRTGLFTSPHLSDVSERVQVDGVPIGREEIATRMTEVATAVRELDAEGDPSRSPTFFEIITALGFLHFDCRRVDVAVLEVGLGGRFDSTNVCAPLLSIITNISYDHMAILGPTLEEISYQKAGIIKRGVPVVVTAETPVAVGVIKKVAREADAPLSLLTCGANTPLPPFRGERGRGVGGLAFASREAPRDTANAIPLAEALSPEAGEREKNHSALDRIREFHYQFHPGKPFTPGRVRVVTPTRDWGWLPLGLHGEHQAANAAGVVAAVEQLREAGLTIPDQAVLNGLRDVVWPARMELLSRRPVVILDCAHNVASAEALVRTMEESFPVGGRRHLVFSSSTDKQIPEMLAVLAPHFDSFHLTRYRSNPRSADPEAVARLLRDLGKSDVHVLNSPDDAWTSGLSATDPDDAVVVAGSVFLAGELRPRMLRDCQS